MSKKFFPQLSVLIAVILLGGLFITINASRENQDTRSKAAEVTPHHGLQITDEELAIWRDRANNGPFKARGDVSVNSIDDWNRVVASKNWFITSQYNKFWVDTGTGCLTGYPPMSTTSGEDYARSIVIPMRDAAFYALIKQDTTVKNKVRDFLLQQSQKVNFNDRTRWCTGKFNKENLFVVGGDIDLLISAMDYLEYLDPNVFTADQRTQLLNWFNGIAEIQYEASVRNNNAVFTDRYNGDYTMKVPNDLSKIPFYGGAPIPLSMGMYNNRYMSANEMLGAVGVLVNNQTYINEAKLVVKEYLMFGVHPDGYMADFDRWLGTFPDLGWKYSTAVSGPLKLADILARKGDTELYDFVTNRGMAGTEGGQKSLKFVIKALQGYIDGTYRRYGTDQAANVGNEYYLIDDRYFPATVSAQQQFFSEGRFIPANLYYRDQHIQDVYMRRAAGLPHRDFLQKYDGADVQLIYPAPYLMFGDLEGKVNPYPTLCIVPSSIVSQWSAEGNTTDSVSGQNATALNNVTYGTGKIGQAFSFSLGSNTRSVNILNASKYNLTSEVSLEAWINPLGRNPNWGSIIAKSTYPTSRNYGLYYYTPQGNLLISYVDQNGNNISLQSPANTITANSWNHVVATIKWGQGGSMNIYVNGELKATLAINSLPKADTSALSIGNERSALPFFGSIDEVAVYNKMLSASEIKSIYQKCPGSSATPTATPTPAPTATSTPLPTATPVPTATPTPRPTSTPTPVNLALNRPVTAGSTFSSTYAPSKAVDGSTSTYWISKNTARWITVDLGALKNISKFVIKHSTGTYTTKYFTIQTSSDNANWTTVVNVNNNTASTTTHTIPTRSARYIKLNIVSPAQNTYPYAIIPEFEVY